MRTPTRRCARGAPRGVRVVTAGAPPAAATIRAIEEGLGWTVTQVYGLTETAPFITVCEERPGARGARRPTIARASRRGRASSSSRPASCAWSTPEGDEVPRDGETLGEIVARGNVVMDGLLSTIRDGDRPR